jgi:hypothetical protein
MKPQKFNITEAEHERDSRDKLRQMKMQNEELFRERKELLRKLEAYELVDSHKPRIIHKPKHNPRKKEATVLTLLSDLHTEERITKRSTNGLNELNPEITAKRLKNYFINLVKLTENNRRDVTINELVLCLLGDNIHGFIHEEYLTTNYMTPIEAMVFVLEELESGLNYIVQHGKFTKIRVICKIGNHSRTTKKIYSESEMVNSYEYMIYKMLQKKFSDQIEFQIDESYFSYFTIYDKIIRAEHGHAFRYAGGIGGIYVPLVRHLYKTNKTKPFDLAVMGHWHQLETLNMALINGSVCGFNAWNMKCGFDFQKPMQQFQLVDSQRGFTVNSKIFVD